jgi:hypothetical protein
MKSEHGPIYILDIGRWTCCVNRAANAVHVSSLSRGVTYSYGFSDCRTCDFLDCLFLPRLVSSWAFFAAAFGNPPARIDMAGMDSRLILHTLNRLFVLFFMTASPCGVPAPLRRRRHVGKYGK